MAKYSQAQLDTLDAEKDIDGIIREGVTRAGGMCVKLESKGVRGWPDRFVGFPRKDGRPGRAYWVEVKASKGRLTDSQLMMLGKLKSCGLDVRIIRGALDAHRFCNEVCHDQAYDPFGER